ncbi:hypothetical protein [Soonwooa sp.]|uniref:hypothetical protein n=1 Tax=Soonwooa sp. TaxID=1938592 RepID=UPI00262F0C88|nr:hypothetical protein [Soonwooa sp.]
MKQFFILFIVVFGFTAKAQTFTGEIYLRDRSNLFLNQFYVTNLNTQKTVLADYNGNFTLPAKAGDVIRFTSIITERKDLKLTNDQIVTTKNFIELSIAYYEFQEVIVSAFKASGNLRKDVTSLKSTDKSYEIRKVIGLPAPKGDGTPPQESLMGLRDGGYSLSISSLYDMLSGEAKKKKRLYEYERMEKSISGVQKYFGDDYFVRLKVPKEFIQNFLQFIYSSDNIAYLTEAGNYEAIKPYIERYLPVYQKRLKNSHLAETNP